MASWGKSWEEGVAGMERRKEGGIVLRGEVKKSRISL